MAIEDIYRSAEALSSVEQVESLLGSGNEQVMCDVFFAFDQVPDQIWAQQVCARYFSHSSQDVRWAVANALLLIARRHEQLDESLCHPFFSHEIEDAKLNQLHDYQEMLEECLEKVESYAWSSSEQGACTEKESPFSFAASPSDKE